MIDIDRFTQDVCDIAMQIPHGKVATYGQIAWLAGWPMYARLVGRVMKNMPVASGVPCHRVVNHLGRLAPGFAEQRARLLSENVVFRPNGNVDLRRSQWCFMDEKAAAEPTHE